MGNSKSVQSLGVMHLQDPQAWQVDSKTGYCDIMRNTQTGQIAQQYTFPLDGRFSFSQEAERYQFRRTQNSNLVAVYHVEKVPSEYMCAGRDLIKVMTERIPFRLSDLSSLSEEQALLVLHEAFMGFKLIKEKYGTVRVDGDMIGFTPEGYVRVWLNENYSKNHPQLYQDVFHNFGGSTGAGNTEAAMIQQIFKEVEEHTASKAYSPRFRQALHQEQLLKFFEAIGFIRQFSDDNGILLPERVNLPSGVIPRGMMPQYNNGTFLENNSQRGSAFVAPNQQPPSSAQPRFAQPASPFQQVNAPPPQQQLVVNPMPQPVIIQQEITIAHNNNQGEPVINIIAPVNPLETQPNTVSLSQEPASAAISNHTQSPLRMQKAQSQNSQDSTAWQTLKRPPMPRRNYPQVPMSPTSNFAVKNNLPNAVIFNQQSPTSNLGDSSFSFQPRITDPKPSSSFSDVERPVQTFQIDNVKPQKTVFLQNNSSLVVANPDTTVIINSPAVLNNTSLVSQSLNQSSVYEHSGLSHSQQFSGVSTPLLQQSTQRVQFSNTNPLPQQQNQQVEMTSTLGRLAMQRKQLTLNPAETSFAGNSVLLGNASFANSSYLSNAPAPQIVAPNNSNNYRSPAPAINFQTQPNVPLNSPSTQPLSSTNPTINFTTPPPLRQNNFGIPGPIRYPQYISNPPATQSVSFNYVPQNTSMMPAIAQPNTFQNIVRKTSVDSKGSASTATVTFSTNPGAQHTLGGLLQNSATRLAGAQAFSR